MAKPSDYPDFATDTNYTGGPDVGTATKVKPSAAVLAEGHRNGLADAPLGQAFNWWKNLVGQWIRHFDESQRFCALFVDGYSLAVGARIPLAIRGQSGGFGDGAGVTPGEITFPASGWYKIDARILAGPLGGGADLRCKLSLPVVTDQAGRVEGVTTLATLPLGAIVEITDYTTQSINVLVETNALGAYTAFLDIIQVGSN